MKNVYEIELYQINENKFKIKIYKNDKYYTSMTISGSYDWARCYCDATLHDIKNIDSCFYYGYVTQKF